MKKILLASFLSITLCGCYYISKPEVPQAKSISGNNPLYQEEIPWGQASSNLTGIPAGTLYIKNANIIIECGHAILSFRTTVEAATRVQLLIGEYIAYELFDGQNTDHKFLLANLGAGSDCTVIIEAKTMDKQLDRYVRSFVSSNTYTEGGSFRSLRWD